ncbi:TSUP family transporter [Streptomyces sp. NPDC093586]|uniref:TSUP family transporter n=1 Tax=Streptomyces sp. NPDC093586 TaxID=3366042 RepID=UPI0037FDA71D
MLGVFVAAVACLVWFREHRRPATRRAHPSTALLAGLGFGVAVAAGVVGIGGPMPTVPLLVALGVPVLETLASAQAQSVVIAGAGTVGHVAHGTVDWPLAAGRWPLAAQVGVPELAGALAG